MCAFSFVNELCAIALKAKTSVTVRHSPSDSCFCCAIEGEPRVFLWTHSELHTSVPCWRHVRIVSMTTLLLTCPLGASCEDDVMTSVRWREFATAFRNPVPSQRRHDVMDCVHVLERPSFSTLLIVESWQIRLSVFQQLPVSHLHTWVVPSCHHAAFLEPFRVECHQAHLFLPNKLHYSLSFSYFPCQSSSAFTCAQETG